MSSAHIEMNAAMNGLSSYSIRLDWNSYTQRMHILPRVRNVNSVCKMALSLAGISKMHTNRAHKPLDSFAIPENHLIIDNFLPPSSHYIACWFSLVLSFTRSLTTECPMNTQNWMFVSLFFNPIIRLRGHTHAIKNQIFYNYIFINRIYFANYLFNWTLHHIYFFKIVIIFIRHNIY